MLFDHLNKFSKRTALISEKLEKLSYAELISRADKIGRQVSKKSLIFIKYLVNILKISGLRPDLMIFYYITFRFLLYNFCEFWPSAKIEI